MKIKKATIVRTILLAVAIINRVLTSKGIGFNVFMDEALELLERTGLWYKVGVSTFFS